MALSSANSASRQDKSYVCTTDPFERYVAGKFGIHLNCAIRVSDGHCQKFYAIVQSHESTIKHDSLSTQKRFFPDVDLSSTGCWFARLTSAKASSRGYVIGRCSIDKNQPKT